ncbi:hypothetical protein ACSBR2_039123 [Camellia fascicularis]
MGVVIVAAAAASASHSYCEANANVVFVGGKRKLRSMFWKVRAEIRRHYFMIMMMSNKKQKQKQKQRRFSFQYDPFSYALNFDNGNFGFFC